MHLGKLTVITGLAIEAWMLVVAGLAGLQTLAIAVLN